MANKVIKCNIALWYYFLLFLRKFKRKHTETIKQLLPLFKTNLMSNSDQVTQQQLLVCHYFWFHTRGELILCDTAGTWRGNNLRRHSSRISWCASCTQNQVTSLTPGSLLLPLTSLLLSARYQSYRNSAYAKSEVFFCCAKEQFYWVRLSFIIMKKNALDIWITYSDSKSWIFGNLADL